MEEMLAALSTENEPSIFRQKATATTSKTERTSLDGSEASGPKKARIDCSQGSIASSLPKSGTSEAVTFELRQGVAFHFYSSHPPCGDATISPKEDARGGGSEGGDIHRTGAKSAEDGDANVQRSGADYHVLGAVRYGH